MANPKGNPQNLRSWKSGVSGNPQGRPVISEDLKAIRGFDLRSFNAILVKYWNVNVSDLEIAIQNKSLPAIEVLLARVLYEGIKTGSVTHLNAILDRIIGKPRQIEEIVPDSGEHEGARDESVNRILSMILDKNPVT